ncbi:FABP family protein (plasmid) [Streptomyces sp. BI20]|uniref:FABP family protein n=1 Tax=Streptomyces sp. BI20 TaxID=3403460 RepID=UPI003C78E29F
MFDAPQHPPQDQPYAQTHTVGEGPEPHPQVLPVLDLIGRWHGWGRGEYPTLADGFRYAQEVSFAHDGRPFLAYEARAWLVDAEGTPIRPAGRETGWWRVLPDTSLEVVLAHPTGIVETYLGTVTPLDGGGIEVLIETDAVTTTPRAKEVTATRRRYVLREGELTVDHAMAAVGQPLTHHLAARLTRHAPRTA